MFDAIDFACTGGVTRFDEYLGNTSEKQLKVLPHLNSSPDRSSVKLTATIIGEDMIFERTVSSRKEAKIDSKTNIDRTKTLMALTGIWQKNPDIRVENLVHLFRATHLFGQDYQSLTSDFKKDSMLSNDIVTRMLAFQDYVEATNKVKKTLSELKKQSSQKEKELQVLKGQLEREIAEREKLEYSQLTATKPEALIEHGKQLAAKLSTALEVPIVVSKKIEKDEIHEWRVSLITNISHLTQQMELIQDLETQFPEYNDNKKRENEISKALVQHRKNVNELKESQQELEIELHKTGNIFQSILHKEKDLLTQQANYEWLTNNQIRYAELFVELRQEKNNEQQRKERLPGLQTTIESKQTALGDLNKNISDLTFEIEALNRRKNQLDKLANKAEDWIRSVVQQKETKEVWEKNSQQVDNLSEAAIENESKLADVSSEFKKLLFQLNQIEESYSGLQSLLGEVETYIQDNVCPVCGVAHNSHEELLEKLTSQRGKEPDELKRTRYLLNKAKTEKLELQEKGAALQSALESVKTAIENQERVLDDLVAKSEDFHQSVVALGFPQPDEQIVTILQNELQNLAASITEKNNMVTKKQSIVGNLNDELSTLINEFGNEERNLGLCRIQIGNLQEEAEGLERESSSRQVSLNMDVKTIRNSLNKISATLEEVRSSSETKRAEDFSLQEKHEASINKKQQQEEILQKLSNNHASLNKNIQRFDVGLERLGLGHETSYELLLTRKRQLQEQMLISEDLRAKITDLELALDTAELSPTLARIENDIEKLNKAVQKTKSEYRNLSEWNTYFNKIHRELKLCQSTIVHEYTDNYAPLISTLQKRLRPVFGFGDMSLHEDKGGIAVHVEHAGTMGLRPTHYFSESQIQIVMLSLFLSLTMSQTWSSFAPILLDDPVQHFDDLNAYAFVDLIWFLAMNHPIQRQFIISTCDENLFGLMRQKSDRMGFPVIFYQFETIGENGPIIQRL